MKPRMKFNARTNKFDFETELDEKDLQEAQEIQTTLMSPGWKLIRNYYEYGREQILDAGKAGARKTDTKDLSPIRWGMLDGFDQCAKLPEIIVKRAEDFLDKAEQEAQDDGPQTGA